MNILVLGMGEVGKAHYNLLKKSGMHIFGLDLIDKLSEMENAPEKFDIVLVAIRYSDRFVDICKNAVKNYQPKVLINCSTVPVGTTESIHPDAVHCTTRGLHPNLESGLLNITKHVGGRRSEEVAALFMSCGIPCEVHKSSRTTELAHILNNVAYGVNLMLADELQSMCRQYGVDYTDAVIRYTQTNNDGYVRIDNPSKVRPVLTPPNGKIGGHCVKMSANLLDNRTPIIDQLSKYGDK